MNNSMIEDHVEVIKVIKRKLSALSNLVHDKLTSAETNAEAKWIKDKFIKKLYEESSEDYYILFTILIDIEGSIERLNTEVLSHIDELKKADNVKHDQEPTLPANNE